MEITLNSSETLKFIKLMFVDMLHDSKNESTFLIDQYKTLYAEWLSNFNQIPYELIFDFLNLNILEDQVFKLYDAPLPEKTSPILPEYNSAIIDQMGNSAIPIENIAVRTASTIFDQGARSVVCPEATVYAYRRTYSHDLDILRSTIGMYNDEISIYLTEHLYNPDNLSYNLSIPLEVCKRKVKKNMVVAVDKTIRGKIPGYFDTIRYYYVPPSDKCVLYARICSCTTYKLCYQWQNRRKII
jgi:hypothetical protein